VLDYWPLKRLFGGSQQVHGHGGDSSTGVTNVATEGVRCPATLVPGRSPSPNPSPRAGRYTHLSSPGRA
jgi:hypothetical protein